MEDIVWSTAEALDNLEGKEALATHMRFLAVYSYERISAEMGLSTDHCHKLALGGLRKVKSHVFDQYKNSPS